MSIYIQRIALLLLMSISINGFSHENECHFDLEYDLKINGKTLTISDHNKEWIRINDANELFIKGEKQTLNAQQDALVQTLKQDYMNLVPSIAKVAGEAAEIGLKAATLTLNALFIDDPTTTEELVRKLDSLSEKISEHVSETQFNGSTINNRFMDREYSDELETLISDIASKASGKIMTNVFRQVFSSDPEETKDFEFRMEMFEHDLETEVEKEALALEQATEKMCDQLKRINSTEEQLSKSLSSFAQIDIVKIHR